MEIAGFGLINSDMIYDRFSASSPFRGPGNFEEILRRTASNNDSNAPVDRRSPHSQIDKEDKLYQLCLELETFLVKNLLNSMRSTIQKSGLVDEGFAGKMYEDMLYEEYAKSFTMNANFGLAEQAYRQLKG